MVRASIGGKTDSEIQQDVLQELSGTRAWRRPTSEWRWTRGS
jgi:hypothetical protein